VSLRLTGRAGPLVSVLAVLAAVLLGAVTAAVALLYHRDALRVQDVLLPWGLVLATLGSALPSLGLRAVGADRAAVIGYGVAWCVVVMVVLGGRSEGDYLVAADFRGWGFLLVAPLLVVIVTMRAVLGPGRTRRDGTADAGVQRSGRP
jgi:hypothetical protein